MKPRTAGASGAAPKVLKVLLAFTSLPGKPSAEQVARFTRLPLSSVYRYLATLRETGFVCEDGAGRFYVGPVAVGLGRAARAAIGYVELARPVLERLSRGTGETVLLVRRSGTQSVCIERWESTHPLRLAHDVGMARSILIGGAVHKVLLAYASADEQKRIIDAAPRDLRVDKEALLAELSLVRKRGYDSTVGEINPEVWGVSAPIIEHDRVDTAVALAAPAHRYKQAERMRLTSATRAAAQEISGLISDYTL